LILFAVASLISSCNNIQKGFDLENLITHEKRYSPDSLKYLIRYSFDNGAFGNCCNQTSLLKITDSLTALNEFVIPSLFENPQWINVNEIRVDIHTFQMLRARGDFDPSYPDLEIDTINDVHLSKNYFNLITDNDFAQVKFSKISPDSNLILVVYEYAKNKHLDDSVLHVSIMLKGEQIPKYGNCYIVSSNMYDQIESFDWKTSDSIEVVIKDNEKNYGLIELYEISNTSSYPELINKIKKKLTKMTAIMYADVLASKFLEFPARRWQIRPMSRKTHSRASLRCLRWFRCVVRKLTGENASLCAIEVK